MNILSKKVIGKAPYGDYIAAEVPGFDSPYYYIDQKKDIVEVVVVRDGKVLLNKQFRIPVQKEVYDLPAGLIEEGESIEDAARRELEEETGYVAEKLELMGSFLYRPGQTNAKNYVFFTDSVKEGKKNLDPNERIEPVWMDFPSCISKFLSEEGHDFTMIASLIMAERFMREKVVKNIK